VVDTSASPEKIVGTYRLIDATAASACGGFYSEDEYDLAGLFLASGPARQGLLELGRSCVAPNYRTSAAIALLWRGIAAHCEAADVDYLFGCASFPGTDPEVVAGELDLLHRFHRSPLGIRALRQRFVSMKRTEAVSPDYARLWRSLPPLIRGYLQVGAKVADGAVIDHDFGTIDVFIILETQAIRDRYRRHFMGLERT
jgi:putative hemolysin